MMRNNSSTTEPSPPPAPTSSSSGGGGTGTTSSRKRGRWGDHRPPPPPSTNNDTRRPNGADEEDELLRRRREGGLTHPRGRWREIEQDKGGSHGGAASSSSSTTNSTTAVPVVSQDDALRALLQSVEAQKQQQKQQRQQVSTRPPSQARGGSHNSSSSARNARQGGGDAGFNKGDDAGYYGPSSRGGDGSRHGASYSSSRDEAQGARPSRSEMDRRTGGTPPPVQPPEDDKDRTTKPQQPDFGLSGALTKDSRGGNVYKGIVLKFREPPEARAPTIHWRLYVHKGDELVETLHVSRQSAYLFGRATDIVDIVLLHPSCSTQHAVLQYRAVPSPEHQNRLHTQPYLMDLESTNGTFLNNIPLDPARYYQLKKGDVLRFGASTREYILLHE